MNPITIDNLPAKFHPFLLGHNLCKKEIDVDSIFENPLVPLTSKKNYVFDGGDWVLKHERTDGLPTNPDSHLYRIRKAEKVRQYILKHNLEEALVVPEKYLYWKEDEKRFYVVCEKVELSDEVAAPATQTLEDKFIEAAAQLGGQVQALVDGNPKRSLTPIQAKALAELSCLGYTDLSYNNLYFDRKGRVAIIDTEPQKRALNKGVANSWMAPIADKGALRTQQSLSGTAKLKLYCDDEEAVEEIEKVEKQLAVWSLITLITKIAIACLVLYATTFIRLLPIHPSVAKALQYTLIAVSAIKLLFLSLQLLSVKRIWDESHNGLPGVQFIAGCEQQGLL